MGILSRARGFALRFVSRSRHGWSLLGIRRSRDAAIIGDGSGSSIVMSVVGWIMRNFPEAPVRVRQRGPKRELEETDDVGAIAFLDLLESPNGWYSGVLLWMATIADFWLSGNGYWLKVRSGVGTGARVIAYWWIPSFVIEPKWDDGPDSDFIKHYLYKPTAIDEYEIPPTDVVHFRFGFDPDNPRKGRSPIASVLREIMTDEEAATYTASILRNLGVPGVLISPDEENVDLDDDDAEALKAQFMGQFGGDHRGEPMVVGAKTKVTVLSFNPTEMDLKTIRRVPEERISGVIGVPAIVAGLGAGLERSTFANYAEAREAGYEENIIPTHRILSADLKTQALVDFVDDVKRFAVDFDVSDVRVLQEDQNKLWERVGAALEKGAITLADFNRAVGLPVDKKLHDVYLRDVRVVAIRVDDPVATGDQPPEPAVDANVDPNAVEDPTDGTVPVVPKPGSANGNGAKPPAVPVA